MPRHSYLLVSAAFVTGCAGTSSLPLLETADSSIDVQAPRRMAAADRAPVEQFSALEANNLDTIEPRGTVDTAAAVPSPKAAAERRDLAAATLPSGMSEPVAVDLPEDDEFYAEVDVATGDEMLEDERAVENYFTDRAPLRRMAGELSTDGRSGADALTAAQMRYQAPSASIVAEAAPAPEPAPEPMPAAEPSVSDAPMSFAEAPSEEDIAEVAEAEMTAMAEAEPEVAPEAEEPVVMAQAEQAAAPAAPASRPLELAGRTGADALTAAQVRYRPIPDVLDAQPGPVAEEEPAPVLAEAEPMPEPAPVESVAPAAAPEEPEAPVIMAQADMDDADSTSFVRRLDPTGRTGADALTAAQVRYEAPADDLAVASATPDETVTTPAPSGLPEPVLAEAPDAAVSQAPYEAADAQDSGTVTTAYLRRLDATGRSGADALTAAQVRYEAPMTYDTSEEDTMTPEIVAMAEMQETQMEETAPETANVTEVVTGSSEVSTRSLNAEGRSGADALTAAQVRYSSSKAAPAVSQSTARLDASEALPAEPPQAEPASSQSGIAVAATASDSTQATADAPSSDDLSLAAARKAVAAVNALRVENGLEPLTYNAELSQVAKAHVIDLAARGEVTARDSEGRGIGERLELAGLEPLMAGSLVSGGYSQFEKALESWQSNDLQRSRLLMEGATDMGFAVISDRRSTYGFYIETIVAKLIEEEPGT